MDEPTTGLDDVCPIQVPARIAEVAEQARAEQLRLDMAIAAYLYWLPHFGYLLAWPATQPAGGGAP